LWKVHLLRFPGGEIGGFIDSPSGFISGFCAFLVAVPTGLLSANLIAWLIPPIRRSLNLVADFRKSQRDLLRVVRWVSAPALIVGVLAALSGL
jgi:hypothetical protein